MRQKSIFGLLAVIATSYMATSCTPKPIDKDTVKTSYLHEYGVEVADADDWQARGESGQTVKQLKNGSSFTQNWQAGKLHGQSSITFPHTGVISQEFFYDNGVCLWMTVNYPSGAPKRQNTYLPASGMLVSTWYEDGAPRTHEEFKDELLVSGQYFSIAQECEAQVKEGQGERINRDGHGQLLSKEEIKDGERVLEITFYPNGMPKCYTPYENGVVQGAVRSFYPGGEPKSIAEWQNGNINGTVTLFQNGEPVAQVPYVDGRKEGTERRFRPQTTEVVEEILWKNDVRHGASIVYVEGQKVTDWYLDGQKVSRMQFLEAAGTLR